MPTLLFKITYLLALILEMVIRVPHDRERRRTAVAKDQVSGLEYGLLVLLLVGMFILPMVYIFTPWLDFANYALPDWAGWAGVGLAAAALWVFWRAHADLGRNWSPSLQIFERHALITSGIYQFIRHPMYASQWLLALAQILLLQNWIAGLCGLVCFLPLYLLRVPREEQMMLAQFGEEYQKYMHRTGRILPKLGA